MSKAAIAGVLLSLGLVVLFDNYLLPIAGNGTLFYTAFADDKEHYAISFLISMGWIFFFTALIMIVVVPAQPEKEPHGI